MAKNLPALPSLDPASNLSRYLQEIRKFPLLTQEEEFTFAKEWVEEENVEASPRYGGTISYMSPEQARGEGHRVDGRSDIFSLCVVLYELLTERQPFAGSTTRETLENVTSAEPRPPRQVDDTIPKCEIEVGPRIIERHLSGCGVGRTLAIGAIGVEDRHILHDVTLVIDSICGQEVALNSRAGPEVVHDLLAELEGWALATDVEQEVL